MCIHHNHGAYSNPYSHLAFSSLFLIWKLNIKCEWRVYNGIWWMQLWNFSQMNTVPWSQFQNSDKYDFPWSPSHMHRAFGSMPKTLPFFITLQALYLAHYMLLFIFFWCWVLIIYVKKFICESSILCVFKILWKVSRTTISEDSEFYLKN